MHLHIGSRLISSIGHIKLILTDSLRGDHVCELNPLDANDEGGAVSFRDFITDTTCILA